MEISGTKHSIPKNRHFSLTWVMDARPRTECLAPVSAIFPPFSDYPRKVLWVVITKRALFKGTPDWVAIMPPKKKVANEASKKTEQKKKEKIIEVIDRTIV